MKQVRSLSVYKKVIRQQAKETWYSAPSIPIDWEEETDLQTLPRSQSAPNIYWEVQEQREAVPAHLLDNSQPSISPHCEIPRYPPLQEETVPAHLLDNSHLGISPHLEIPCYSPLPEMAENFASQNTAPEITIPEVPPQQCSSAASDDSATENELTSPPKLSHRQAVTQKIFNNIQGDKEFEDAGACCGKCHDVCTGSCNCLHLLIMTNALRRARSKGWKMISIVIFPLLQDIVRDIWVTVELATVLLALLLSIVTFTHNQMDIFNTVHLALAILSGILATIDAIYTLRHCKSCKKCCCEHRNFADEDNETNNCKGKCYSCFRNTLDIFRLILTEILFYPLLICDIFEAITGKAHEGATHIDRVGFTLFILSCLSLVLYVYVARIIVIIGMIKNITDVRTPSNEIDTNGTLYQCKTKRSALCYLIYLFIHVVSQMLAQLLMLVAIAAKVRYDNRHLYEPGNMDESVHVSGYLWYMLAAGYVIPIMGFSTFFVVTYYWTQEFPVGFYLDMISLFAMTTLGPDELVYMDQAAKEKKPVTDNLLSHFEHLKKEFEIMHDEK